MTFNFLSTIIFVCLLKILLFYISIAIQSDDELERLPSVVSWRVKLPSLDKFQSYVHQISLDGHDGGSLSFFLPAYNALLSRKMTILSVSERSTIAPIFHPRIAQINNGPKPRSNPVKRIIRWNAFNFGALILVLCSKTTNDSANKKKKE